MCSGSLSSVKLRSLLSENFLCEQLSDSDVDPSIKRILAKKIVTVTFWDALNKYFGLDIRNITSYYSLIKHYQPMRYQKRFMYKILDVIDNKW